MDTKTIRSKSLSEALDDELLETIDEELPLRAGPEASRGHTKRRAGIARPPRAFAR